MHYTICLLDARGVKLDSCTVSGADFDNRWSSGIRLSGTLGAVQINNCHISNTRNTGIQFSGSASGIVMSSTSIVNGTGSPTGTTVNVYLKSMALYDVRVEGYYYGLSASFSSQANISISNSSFIRNKYKEPMSIAINRIFTTGRFFVIRNLTSLTPYSQIQLLAMVCMCMSTTPVRLLAGKLLFPATSLKETWAVCTIITGTGMLPVKFYGILLLTTMVDAAMVQCT